MMKVTAARLVCVLSVPVIVVMLGGMWAMAPTRLLCTFSRGSMADVKVSLVNPNKLNVPKEEVEGHWIFAETKARFNLVLTAGGICLLAAFGWIWMASRRSANKRLEDIGTTAPNPQP